MVQILFVNVKTTINLNGKMTKTFEIKRRIRQNYSLTPHLFIIIRKMLNVMVNQDVKEGVIQGIKLLEEKGQQITSQYANDTWLTFGGDKDNMKNVIKLLEEFLVASSLELN